MANRAHQGSQYLLHNMNLDELMRSGIIGESGQVVQNPCSTFSSNNPSFLFNSSSSMDKNNNNHHHLQPNLRDTTTFEEILANAEMINHNTSNNNYDVGNQGNNVLVDTKPFIGVDPIVMASYQANWLQMQFPSMQQHHQENLCQGFGDSKPVVENPVMETGYYNSSLGITMPMAAPAAMSSCTCSDSKGVVAGDGGHRGRKRGFLDDVQEQSIDRRQRRMAKNRESAAKSRAKKQAYIEKLENEKSRLLKSNRWLKKLMDFEEILFSNTSLTRTYQLRRTSSNTF